MRRLTGVLIAVFVLAGCGTTNPHHTTAKQIGGASAGGIIAHQLSKATGASRGWANAAGVLGALIGWNLASPNEPQGQPVYLQGVPQGYGGYPQSGGYSQGGGCDCCGVDKPFNGYDEYGGFCSNEGFAVLRKGKMAIPGGQTICPASCFMARQSSGYVGGGETVGMLVPSAQASAEEPKVITTKRGGTCLTVQEYLKCETVPPACKEIVNPGYNANCLTREAKILEKRQANCDKGVLEECPQYLSNPKEVVKELNALAGELRRM